MARSQGVKVRLNKFVGRSLASYIGLVYRTSKVVTEPADTDLALRAAHPAIIATWHGQFQMLVSRWPRDLKVAAMVARHGDAELIGEAMAKLGVELIRGAGAGTRKRDRGGAHALRSAVRALEDGASVVMTADVPPGPARRAGAGIVTIARLSGRPIVPVAAATSRYRALKTWSRLTINLPYSKLAYVVGAPIYVPPDADEATLERLRQEVESGLNQTFRYAYRLAGADPSRATPPAATDASNPPAKPGLRLKAYRTATSMIRPLAPFLLRMRERQGKEDAGRRAERFGYASAERPRGPLVWIHAASVGETNAILPLIDGMGARRRDLNFLLTTGTITSAAIAAKRLNERAIHQYVPLDASEYAGRFLDHWRPNLAVFTESEIWPNLILETAQRKVPLALVNARMSDRSFARWRRSESVSQPLFNRFDVVLAQNDKLARWFSELGARKVEAVGNLKIDAPPPPVDAQEAERLRDALRGRPSLIAASTHDGEDRIIAEAHRRMVREVDGLCTIIAPRHPERGTAIAEMMKELGLNVVQRSVGSLPGDRCDIYVADTIGELGLFYSVCPVAFIGGSLIDRGGQNPIEAVRHGAAVLTGPSWHNFRDAYRMLIRHNGAVEVRTAEELAKMAAWLIRDEAELQRMHIGAAAALAMLSGALEQTITALLPYLPSDEGLRRAS